MSRISARLAGAQRKGGWRYCVLVQKKAADALAAAGDAITAACEACHQPYRDRGRHRLGNGK